MDLVVVGIVVFALLLASYSTRSGWIALGSKAISVAALVGCLFLYTAPQSSHIRASVTELAELLPYGWDQPVLNLAATFEETSTSVARALSTPQEPVQAASTTSWFGAAAKNDSERETEGALETPIQWFLDEPPPPGAERFLVDGVNVSDQPLEAVRAVLKPDSGADDLNLALDVQGGNTGAVIPPGARFSLTAQTLTEDEAKELGGAILTVSYMQGGRRKTSIMYLTPPMLAQRAKHD